MHMEMESPTIDGEPDGPASSGWGDVTALLRAGPSGRRAAFDQLIPLIYQRLRQLAHRALAGERHGHTLGTTALAHEAYVRLAGLDRIEWRDRAHFFAAAAGVMRRVLVDHAVARRAQKRGAGVVPVSVDTAMPAVEDPIDGILVVHQALLALEKVHPSTVRIVECRVFMGMTVEETAGVVGVSPATVKRHWSTARAWLARALTNDRGRRG